MSASNATITPVNIVLTPMRVTAYPVGSPSSGGVDLGGTEGGVTLSIKTDLADIMVDQFGKTPINSIVSGHAFGVKCTLAETANKARWKEAFPHFNLVTDGSGNTLFVFNMEVGDSLLSHAGRLNLHPLDKPDNDTSQDININLAACKSAAELKYGPDKQVGIAVEFMVYPDTTVIPARFMTFGDPTISPVAATAAAAVPGSNTGNGTVSSPVAFSGVTITETITLSCVAVDSSHGNVFTVIGSVSGSLGTIEIASTSGGTQNFSNPKIGFTLHQGTVEYAYGDSFTIATVAANYA